MCACEKCKVPEMYIAASIQVSMHSKNTVIIKILKYWKLNFVFTIGEDNLY